VGVIGYTNAGKSSVINVLKHKAVCKTGSNTFLTKLRQEVKLNQKIVLIDTPSVVLISEQNQNNT